MHPWVAISSLILLLTDAVVSDAQGSGVVGQPAILPCTYSTANGVTTTCWGQGACPRNLCSDELVWIDGTNITFQKHTRYKLEGDLLKGNVSLTIQNAAQVDSGQYSCPVEHPGWFNDMKHTLSLEIKPAEVTHVPASPRVFTSASPVVAPTQSLQPVATSSSPLQTAETQPTTLQGTRTTQPTNSPLYSCPTDGSGTVTQSSDGLRHSNQIHVSLAQNPRMITSKRLHCNLYSCHGIVHFFGCHNPQKIFMHEKQAGATKHGFTDPQIRALQSTAEVCVRAEDSIYIIEDNHYVME